MLIATAGPPPYDVEMVMRWSIGSITALGVLFAFLIKRALVWRLAAAPDRPATSRLALASVAEGLLLIAALYTLQIPTSVGTGTLVGLVAFILVGACIANGLALRRPPGSARSRHLGWTLLVTLIYPFTQTLVALTLGPSLNGWFIRLFP
jgi:hypothetical protein